MAHRVRYDREDRLGIGFDIQGGGSDLVFPHHEMSAGHGEAHGRGRTRDFVHQGWSVMTARRCRSPRATWSRVDAARPVATRWPCVLPSSPITSGTPGSGRTTCWRPEHGWRPGGRPSLPVGPTGWTVVEVRERLADDLDNRGPCRLSTPGGRRSASAAARALRASCGGCDALLGVLVSQPMAQPALGPRRPDGAGSARTPGDRVPAGLGQVRRVRASLQRLDVLA